MLVRRRAERGSTLTRLERELGGLAAGARAGDRVHDELGECGCGKRERDARTRRLKSIGSRDTSTVDSIDHACDPVCWKMREAIWSIGHRIVRAPACRYTQEGRPVAIPLSSVNKFVGLLIPLLCATGAEPCIIYCPPVKQYPNDVPTPRN